MNNEHFAQLREWEQQKKMATESKRENKKMRKALETFYLSHEFGRI